MPVSRRKPLNDTAGYVCSRKCVDGGYVMVVDRNNGGDWIDATTRWVVSKHDSGLLNQGLIDMPTKADAIEFMKATAIGEETCWYEGADS